ncbi:MAG: amidohydrolase family protein [Acidobacteriia bacterium]|nr:amidohydrolase family protein [Terriglobia bacterium]
MREKTSILVVGLIALHFLAAPAYSQAEAKSQILITNARVFDGKSDTLADGMNVLVEGNKIAKISKAQIATSPGATVIDAKGRVMTPGFIDAHIHLMAQMPFAQLRASDDLWIAYVGAQQAKTELLEGFTTVRDVAGNTFSLKKAIDRGLVMGPRIYPSGPMISQTSGHADQRFLTEPPTLLGGHVPFMERQLMGITVDGETQVLTAVRQVLRHGASQIKIASGGGTGSEYDPLDVTEFTLEETRAAVQAASDWGTYVCTHVYNTKGIRRAIEAGVKSIEHGNLLDEPTLQLMKDKGIWLSPQVLTFTGYPLGYTDEQKAKHDQALAGVDNMFTMAKKIGFTKIVFGTDVITNPEVFARNTREFELRAKWFTPAEILRQATSQAAELLALSGPRNPYPGKLGVSEEGAYADLLLINGNPLADISILTKPEENLALIMKDGKIYRNTVK